MNLAPTPSADLRRLAQRYLDTGNLDALGMLANGQSTRAALSSYDEQCVRAARDANATWSDVGDALGLARQNAERKYRHVEQARREEAEDA